MPRTSPYVIILSREERRALESRARKYTLPYFQVVRALMILLAAEGHSNDEVAGADFFTTEVWTWRGLVTYYTVFVIDLASRPAYILSTRLRIPTSCSCGKSVAR